MQCEKMSSKHTDNMHTIHHMRLFMLNNMTPRYYGNYGLQLYVYIYIHIYIYMMYTGLVDPV